MQDVNGSAAVDMYVLFCNVDYTVYFRQQRSVDKIQLPILTSYDPGSFSYSITFKLKSQCSQTLYI